MKAFENYREFVLPKQTLNKIVGGNKSENPDEDDGPITNLGTISNDGDE